MTLEPFLALGWLRGKTECHPFRSLLRRLPLLIFFISVTAQSAFAQEPGGLSSVLLPGSVNASIGTQGPLEPGNVVATATIQQGFTAWRRGPLFLVGFVDVTLRADTLGHAWNNVLPYVAGVKFVAAGRGGVVQAALGVAGQFRDDDQQQLMRAASVSYWAGWRGATSHLHLPGSVWAVSGVSVPSEPDNWITSAHIDQGVAVWRRPGAALVPFAAVTATIDTEGRAWNNRGVVDAGVKVSARIRGMAVDVGVAQRVARPWETRESTRGAIVFTNVWLGWSPRVTY